MCVHFRVTLCFILLSLLICFICHFGKNKFKARVHLNSHAVYALIQCPYKKYTGHHNAKMISVQQYPMLQMDKVSFFTMCLIQSLFSQSKLLTVAAQNIYGFTYIILYS